MTCGALVPASSTRRPSPSGRAEILAWRNALSAFSTSGVITWSADAARLEQFGQLSLRHNGSPVQHGDVRAGGLDLAEQVARHQHRAARPRAGPR